MAGVREVVWLGLLIRKPGISKQDSPLTPKARCRGGEGEVVRECFLFKSFALAARSSREE